MRVYKEYERSAGSIHNCFRYPFLTLGTRNGIHLLPFTPDSDLESVLLVLDLHTRSTFGLLFSRGNVGLRGPAFAGRLTLVDLPFLQSGSSVAEIEALGEMLSYSPCHCGLHPFVLVVARLRKSDGSGYLDKRHDSNNFLGGVQLATLWCQFPLPPTSCYQTKKGLRGRVLWVITTIFSNRNKVKARRCLDVRRSRSSPQHLASWATLHVMDDWT
jgi:hypothetical protein